MGRSAHAIVAVTFRVNAGRCGMPLMVQAGAWGLLAGAALLIGALIGYLVKVPPRWIAGVMAFGSGVLISALAFELMDEAFHRGGVKAASAGMIMGATLFT